MRAFFIGCTIALAISSVAQARQTRVDGYWRKDGTYVAPHARSAPNGNTYDNWSSKGNYNPYTGQEGTANPYPSTPSYRPKQTTLPPLPGLPPLRIKPCAYNTGKPC